jgi:SNF2 family DNA or RNA helicase
MVFVGLSDSYESYYQAVRRCWRFGQTRPVEVTIIASNREQAVLENVRRKEQQAQEMFRQLAEAS